MPSFIRARALCIALIAVGLASTGFATNALAATSPHYRFALITHAQPGDSFWDLVRKGAQDAADKDGVDLIYLRGDSPSKQAAKLQNAINQPVDGIALTLAFPDAMAPLVKQALAHHIPVVALNAGSDSWKKMGISTYIGQDAKIAGEAVGDRLNEEGAKNVVCVNQQQGAVQLANRCAGIQDTFKGKMQTLYLDGYDMSQARSRIMAKVMQDPSIDYVVTLGAPFAPVAVSAVDMAHSKAKVATFDLNPRTAKLIKDHKVAWAVDQQPYLQGYEAIDLLYLEKTNGNLLGGGRAVLTGPAFVTQQNIDQIMKYIDRGTR